jgi:hypothetical protein
MLRQQGTSTSSAALSCRSHTPALVVFDVVPQARLHVGLPGLSEACCEVAGGEAPCKPVLESVRRTCERLSGEASVCPVLPAVVILIVLPGSGSGRHPSAS